MAKSNLKLNLEMFLYIHMLRDKYPDMTSSDIATNCKGRFGVSISTASVRVALKFNAYDELEEYRASQRKKTDVFDAETEQDGETIVLDGITQCNVDDDLEDTLKEIICDASEVSKDDEPPKEIAFLAWIEGLFERFFISPGSKDYPDETIGKKLGGAVAAINCTKKEVANTANTVSISIDALLELITEKFEELYDDVFRIKDDIKVSNDALETICKLLKRQNELTERLVIQWEAGASDKQNMEVTA